MYLDTIPTKLKLSHPQISGSGILMLCQPDTTDGTIQTWNGRVQTSWFCNSLLLSSAPLRDRTFDLHIKGEIDMHHVLVFTNIKGKCI